MSSLISDAEETRNWWTYGNTAVATDNGDDDVLGEREISEDLGYEGRGADDIEGSDTEKANIHQNAGYFQGRLDHTV